MAAPRHALVATLRCHTPVCSCDGWLISLVHEGRGMRTSPAIRQAGDFLLVDATTCHPVCHWLYLPHGLGVWQRPVEFHGETTLVSVRSALEAGCAEELALFAG